LAISGKFCIFDSSETQLKHPNMMQIRSYGKGELAQLYCPNVTAAAARKKLKSWMYYYPHLMENLRSIGYTDVSRSFTPAQVRLIVEALGEP